MHCRSLAACVWGDEIHALGEFRRTRDASLPRAPVISSSADFSLKGEINSGVWTSNLAD